MPAHPLARPPNPPSATQYLPSWTRRWIVLQGDQLLCYHSRGATAPDSILSLSLVHDVRRACADARDRLQPLQPFPHTGQLRPPPCQVANVLVVCGAERALTLRADSPAELERWFRAISMHVRLWQKHRLRRENSDAAAAAEAAAAA